MDVASSVEMQPLHSYTSSGEVDEDTPWTETDLFVWLPGYVGRSIETSSYLHGCSSRNAKLRFVEAVIFAVVVVYIVAVAAMPAYA